jgi:2-(1,2-epoxy-1,2-dihydrophenyl)acetyl-CoA isomerase
MSERLLVTRSEGVKRIIFNAPERRNAIDNEAFARFHDAVVESAQDGTRILILTGAGDAFCSGADLQAGLLGGASGDVATLLRTVVSPAVKALREMPIPVIARVHGVAAGIGCSFALAADLRIASHDARFSLGFARIGLVPDGGATWMLPRLVGHAKAFELMITGDLIDAAEAHRLGLVNAVVDSVRLDETVDAWTARLLQAPELAVAAIKRALHYGQTHTLTESLDLEALLQQTCYESEDFREGVAAFREKRQAKFQGR